MLPLTLRQDAGLRILWLGAHCDDIEIGCGGTIMRLIEEYSTLKIRWVVFTSTPERTAEASASAAFFLQKVPDSEVSILNFRDGFLPYNAVPVKNVFEDLKAYQPDVIFTHFRHDLHQDHRLVSELSWNTFRNHLILEYEIPKYDGDLGSPNFFVPLRKDTAAVKIEALHRYYQSQTTKHWFDKETFASLLRIRGLECASDSGYAEGFYLRKAVF
jgi:LmbE family N-acetylglucosaminyl deacetylase